MESKTVENKFLSLGWRDLLIGAILAAVSGGFTVLLATVQAGSLEFDWKAIATTSLSALLAYLGKNLFEPSRKITIEPIEEK